MTHNHAAAAAVSALVFVALLAGVSAQVTTTYHTDATCTFDKMLVYSHSYSNFSGIPCTAVDCRQIFSGPGLYLKQTCGPLTFALLGVVIDEYEFEPAYGSTVCNGTKKTTNWSKVGVCFPPGLAGSGSTRYSVSGNDADSTIITESCSNADCSACTRTELYKGSKQKCSTVGRAFYYGVSPASKTAAIATVVSSALAFLLCAIL